MPSSAGRLKVRKRIRKSRTWKCIRVEFRCWREVCNVVEFWY